jgi:putative ABC transport system permease protein
MPDSTGPAWIETFVQDSRYGIRSLRRTPAFTIAALVTLALGIGANTAIFSVVHAVLLRPLPYPEPDRIVQLLRRAADGDSSAHTGAQYMFFRDNMTSVDALAAWRGPTGFNMVAGDSAEYVRAMPVSREYFQVFGVRPVFGDVFAPDQDRVGGADVVILGYGLFARLFAANPAVIGTSTLLGDRPHTIVGVMPRDFRSMPPADLYVPLRPSTTGPGGGFNYSVAGRLRAGVPLAQAQAEAAAVFESMIASYAAAHPDARKPSYKFALAPFQSSISRFARPALLLMLGAVGMLFLIACANTANLLLARASGRGREIAVRAALGAGRGRIARQLLTESIVLFVAGGTLGILLAYWSVPALLTLTPSTYTVYQDVTIDARVLTAMLLLSAVSGLIFGLVPALTLSRHELVEAFKEDGTRTTSNRRSAWLRKTLVVAEVALCMLLLIGAGLLIQTFARMRAVDPGFDVHNVLTARMSMQGDRYATSEDINRFFSRGLEQIRRIPGVQSASVVNGVPIARALNLNVDVLDGPEPIEAAVVDWRYASVEYFATMGIPIVSGRGFEEGDRAGAQPVAVVSQQFARKFLKDTNPIGRHIRVFKTDGAIEIVGVAKDLSEGGLVEPPIPVMYVPITQANIAGIRASHTYYPMSWVVRASNTGPDMIRRTREELRAVDPKQPVSAFVTMEDVKAQAMSDQTFQMTLLAIFAVIGLVLATAGIYGLIAYSVAQRTREFGIRMALGATRDRILRAVLMQGAMLGLTGVCVGLAGALAFTRSLRNFVYGVSTLDPATFTAVGVLLVLVAAVASLVPAIRAVRLNPTAALRD